MSRGRGMAQGHRASHLRDAAARSWRRHSCVFAGAVTLPTLFVFGGHRHLTHGQCYRGSEVCVRVRRCRLHRGHPAASIGGDHGFALCTDGNRG